MLLPSLFELLHQGILGYTDTHGCQLVTALCHWISYQDIAVETMELLSDHFYRGCDPVVIIRRTHFMRITIFQDIAYADDKDCLVHLLYHFGDRCSCPVLRDPLSYLPSCASFGSGNSKGMIIWLSYRLSITFINLLRICAAISLNMGFSIACMEASGSIVETSI